MLVILDTTDGTRRTIGVGSTTFESPSVSADGKRIAYETGQFGWDVLENLDSEWRGPDAGFQAAFPGCRIGRPSGNPFHLFDSYRRGRWDCGPAGGS